MEEVPGTKTLECQPLVSPDVIAMSPKLGTPRRKPVFCTKCGIGYSCTKGWSTKGTPRMILKKNGSYSYLKNIGRQNYLPYMTTMATYGPRGLFTWRGTGSTSPACGLNLRAIAIPTSDVSKVRLCLTELPQWDIFRVRDGVY